MNGQNHNGDYKQAELPEENQEVYNEEDSMFEEEKFQSFDDTDHAQNDGEDPVARFEAINKRTYAFKFTP